MKNKKVLCRITNNLNVGGVQKRIFDVLSKLIDKYEIHIIVYKEEGVLVSKFEDLGIKVHFIKSKGTLDLFSILNMAKLLKKIGADIVHTHSMGGNIKGQIAGFLAKTPKRIAHIHVLMGLHWYGKTKLKRFKHQIEEKIILSLFTDHIFFVSEAIKNEFFSNHKFNLEPKANVLYNGFNIEKLPSKTSFRENNFRLGVVLRLSETKNLSFIVDIIKDLVSFDIKYNFKFYFIGDGNYTKKLKLLVEEKRLIKYFEFPGATDSPLMELIKLDLVIFPSKNEGLPAGLIEPLLVNVPVLSIKTEINKEIIELDNGGEILDENSYVFARKINEILSNYNKYYEKLRFSEYRKTFDIKNHIEKLLYFYES